MHALDFFAAGVVGFYAAYALISILLMLLLWTEHERLAGLCVVSLFWYLWWIRKFDIIAFARDNPGHLTIWIVSYFVAGALSLYPQWCGFVADRLEERMDHAKKYNKDLSSNDDWIPPDPSDNKERIMS